MRVLMISKALVVGMYQRKLEEMAAYPDIDLTVAVPRFWRERGHDWRLERTFLQGYRLEETAIRLNGHYHLHYYPHLPRLLDRLRPDVLHFDEEPYNLATWLAMRAAHRRRIPVVIFTWQNIMQRYPPPFRWLERDVLRRAAFCQAGNRDAAAIVRAKGFRGPLAVAPQFGIDPMLFTPAGSAPVQPFTVGFVGRLVPQKGLTVLLEALAGLEGDWRLDVVGSGPERERAAALAGRLGIGARVAWRGQVPSTEMPAVLRGFDVLAAPSLTTPSWKEQFGRMLVEAMACGVPVIVSDSGEMPHVVGTGGIVVPEGDVGALRQALREVRWDTARRGALASAGRERVLAHYTQSAVAAETVAIYRHVCGGTINPDTRRPGALADTGRQL